MTLSFRAVCAVLCVLAGVYVIVKSAGNQVLLVTGLGFIAAGVGLVVP